MHKKGFTLAEVLVTLTILGVIAAVTVPGIIGDTQHRDIRAKVQKAYNTLSTAYSMTYIDNYSANKWATSQSAVHNLFAQQLQTLHYSQDASSILSNDGISFQYTPVSTDCTGTVLNSSDANDTTAKTITSYCGTMYANIKGETGTGSFSDRPGINTFAFYLTDGGFIPYGEKGTNFTTPSFYVTGQVIYDGNFDYLK